MKLREKTFISVVKKNINMKDSLSSCTENIMVNRSSSYIKVFITEIKLNLLQPYSRAINHSVDNKYQH